MEQENIDIWNSKEFLSWFDERPAIIQEMVRRFPPNKPYRVQGGRWPGFIYCWSEAKDGVVTMTVTILEPGFGRRVFGLSPDDLEEWEGPRPDLIANN